MEKYYTPEIEEFHIGFEYEVFETPFGKNKGNWNKSILNTPQYFQSINWKWIAENLEKIRVKYLDKEDIESLGFIFDKTSKEGQWKFFKNNICLFYRPETKELGTFTVDPSKSDFMIKYSRDNKMISFLIIKNKSELIKLLKQLKIID